MDEIEETLRIQEEIRRELSAYVRGKPGREKVADILREVLLREIPASEFDFDVQVEADPTDPTKVNVTWRVPMQWYENRLKLAELAAETQP